MSEQEHEHEHEHEHEEHEDEPEQSKGFFSNLLSLFKGIKPGQDLSEQGELDASLVDANSGLELNRKNALEPFQFLIDASNSDSPAERLRCMAKFMLCGFMIDKVAKKPLNPILGEVCQGAVDHDDGSRTIFVAEQVSHHPPISAVHVENAMHGIVVEPCVSRGSARFIGTAVHILFRINWVVRLEKHNETYRITPPDLYIRLFRRSTEFCGDASIVCEQTKAKLTLKYHSKPLFGGKWNRVSGHIKTKKEGKIEIEGHWDDVVRIGDEPFEAKAAQRAAIILNNRKHERASEVVWADFKAAMVHGKMKDAQKAKVAVEVAQRQRRKDKTDFEPKYFEMRDGEWAFKRFPKWKD